MPPEEVEEVPVDLPLATLQRHVEVLGEALVLGAEPLELPLQRADVVGHRAVWVNMDLALVATPRPSSPRHR